MDVPPSGNIVAGGVAVDAFGPGVPVAVHFVPEAQHHRVAPAGQGLSPLAQVGIEVAGGDPVQGIGWLVRAAAPGPGLPRQECHSSAGAHGFKFGQWRCLLEVLIGEDDRGRLTGQGRYFVQFCGGHRASGCPGSKAQEPLSGGRSRWCGDRVGGFLGVVGDD